MIPVFTETTYNIVQIFEGHSDSCICTIVPFVTLVILCGVWTRLEKEGWLNEDTGTQTTLAAISVMWSSQMLRPVASQS